MAMPLFSYPTTIVGVDDSAIFLKALKQLWGNNVTFLPFESPMTCLNFIDNYQPILANIEFMQDNTEAENYDLLNHLPLDLNVHGLKNLRENPLRHQEISVLITDYNMPAMDGISLCRKLKSTPFKKILLTGEADHRQAVEAFNEGIIDGYLRKDSPNLVDEIISQTQKLQTRYLIESTKLLAQNLETRNPLHFSDPKFISFFKQWCEDHFIREYYLLDKLGIFLLINQLNKKFYFIVHTEKTLHSFIELYQDDEEIKHYMQSVKAYEKIPYFGEGLEGWELAFDQWHGCFYTPNVLQGREIYYWAVAE